MKFTGYIVLIIGLGFIAHSFFEFWSIVVVAGFVGLLSKFSGIRAFTVGFTGVAILWVATALFLDNQNNSILSTKIGALFGDMSTLSLMLITALIGGLLGGMGALTGNQGRKLFSLSKKA